MVSRLSLQQIYESLLNFYGPQGWWPLISYSGTNPTLRGRLTGYHCGNYNLPQSEVEMLEIMLGAVLTQNTSWTNAEKALFNLHEKNLIDVDALLHISHDELASLIHSSGYYNQKAIKLKALAQYLKDHPIASLLTRSIDQLRPEMRTVKGLGNETCDSILLYALKKPIFVIDAYTKRLLIRFGYATLKSTYEEMQQLFHATFARDVALYNEFHALIVQHSVHHCLKSPSCKDCHILDSCPQLIQESIPPKKEKKSSRNKK
jgi:endonuclease-3 related protein